MFTNTKSRFHAVRIRFENHVPTSPVNARLWEFFLFAFKQAWACLFGGTLLALVLLTKWLYPPQQNGWQVVHFSKFGSWFLLMIISFILVSFVHRPREPSSLPVIFGPYAINTKDASTP